MKLLIATQAVDENDPNLGFFIAWIQEFARHVDTVTVLCLREGQHSLPSNVRIMRLPSSRLGRVLGVWRYSLARRGEYDAVFVHMNPEYLVVAGLFWQLLGKRAVLWYTHKHVDLKLRIAVLFASVVCTASDASFRLRTRKLRVMGHGIEQYPERIHKSEDTSLRVVTVGRISQTKKISEMLDVMEALHTQGVSFTFTIIGAPITQADQAYEQALKEKIRVSAYGASVHMLGARPHTAIAAILASADVFLNMSTTGSFDKAVLEAIAAGVVPVTTNEAYSELLTPYGLYIASADSKQIAEAIRSATKKDIQELTARVAREHALGGLIQRLVAVLS